ncbi:reticulophagy regulator 1 [Chiloscyllium plagiosum]|uniref:reticulophagy regulator 1 n=1 Tax=Chiloscyllium plagiosum TaxID=36176 RepID=UPI001CB7DFE9|nr:reticulophagy regulator 1 [Chiloscyllium plagiosum]
MASGRLWWLLGSSDAGQQQNRCKAAAGSGDHIVDTLPEEGDAPRLAPEADSEQKWDDSDSLWMLLLNYMETAVTGHRPGCSVAMFICCNALFWFLALTPWRFYSLLALGFLWLVVMETMKALVLFAVNGWRRSKILNGSCKVTEMKQENAPKLSQCITESLMSCTMFFEEMSHFKKQNPGKFCLLVCSLCTFCAVIGRYIPGALVSYFVLLCILLRPLINYCDFGQSIYNKMEPVLQRLDFGLRDYVQHLQARWQMKQKELAERKSEDESEVDTSALCPKVSSSGTGKELSISDTEPSETWTENGTFNLSEGHTPQTDASDDLDHPSDPEEAFARDLPEFPSVDAKGIIDDDDSSIGIPTPPVPNLEPSEVNSYQEGIRTGIAVAGLLLNLSNEQSFNLVSTMATDVIATTVSSAVKGQLQAVEPNLTMPPQLNSSEDTDADEADDFELLDESELEQIENELGLDQGQTANQQAKDGKSGFLANLLGGH